MYKACWVLICVVFLILSASTLAQNAPDVRVLFAQLNQTKTTDRAAQGVLDIAGKDSNAREYVVQRLSQMIDKTEIDKVWLNAVRLAGHLKASETVPSLQRAFSRGQLGRPAGTTLGAEMQLHDDVVAKALAEIGEPSLPAVKAFLKSSDRKDRRRAVLILLNMDAPESRKVLEEHLPHETDPKITRLIESGLRS